MIGSSARHNSLASTRPAVQYHVSLPKHVHSPLLCLGGQRSLFFSSVCSSFLLRTNNRLGQRTFVPVLYCPKLWVGNSFFTFYLFPSSYIRSASLHYARHVCFFPPLSSLCPLAEFVYLNDRDQPLRGRP
jgi:hypothetical protein